jgi:DNA helicase II / ATP-dependent DNA helicase PcrA
MLSKFDEQYARLNTDQKKAVDTIDGPVLVIAGPGTGKTQVLGLRIANILRQTDTNPASVLCLTFQDASVTAMKTRLQTFIGYDAYKVQIHTFHSFCSEIIRSFPYEFDFSDEVEAIKEVDKLAIFKQILTDNKLVSLQQRNDILGYFKGIVGAISNLKKEYITPDKFSLLIQGYENSFDAKERKLNERKIEKMHDLQKFYVKYLELMQEKNLIDFDDMIFKVTDGFSKNDDLVKYFQEQYLYTLVDEFQDTNNAQLQVIKSVGSFEGLDANVFAVGDDDQTIFRFQGASSDNFEKFLNIFPETELVVLHTNYRSKQPIIDSATNVIENNPNRVSELDYFKSLGLNKEFKAFESQKVGEVIKEAVSTIVPQVNEFLPVQAHEFEHSFHEDYWIGSKIKSLIDSGTKFNEVAIIARTNRQIVNITKFLDRFKIPYTIKRSESILENRYIQNLIQVFRISSNPSLLKDDKIMWQVLSQDFLGLNSFDIFGLYHDAKEQKMCMYDFVHKTHLPKYEGILTFINKVIALQQYSLNNTFLNTFTKTLHYLDLIKYLETLPDSYAELNRLSSLFQFASTRCKSDKDYNLDKFLDEVKLMREKNIVIASDPIDIEAENKINILTAHSSKGLEFDHVFIYQTSESKWEKNRGGSDSVPLPPLVLGDSDSETSAKIRKELEKAEDEIDERRLFYVAMTRAKKDLFLTYSKRYYDSDSGEVDVAEKLMSKFIAESLVSDITKHADMVQKHDEIMKIMLAEEEPVKIPERNKDYLLGLVNKELHLSATKLNKYQMCRYKFLLEDVFRLPSPKSLNLEIGTAIHRGIEILTQSYDGKSGYKTFEEIYDEAKKEFDRNIDQDQINTDELGSIDVAYLEIERGLEAYYKYFETNPDKPEFTEFVSVGIFEGINLRGRLDKISKLHGGEEKQFVITDYKTVSSTPSITEFLGFTKAGEDKNHLRQLLFYRLLLESSNLPLARKVAPTLKALRLEYVDTKIGEVKVFEIPTKGMFEFKRRANAKNSEEFNIDEEYEKFKVDLKEAFESIKSLEFERTTDRTKCQFCAFKQHCGR